jgi:LEA14-like dessication related protein
VPAPRLHRLALALGVATALAAGAGCATTSSPQLKVLAVEPQRRVVPERSVVLYVEVVNPASRPMRLQKLQYTFAAHGAAPAYGEVPLTRTIDAGAAVVVEVPVALGDNSLAPGETLTLRGKLYAELDRMVRTFPVSAEVPAPR